MNTHKAVITRVLYELDPMNIGTIENELFTEYEDEAGCLVTLCEKGNWSILHDRVQDVFEFYFWKGCLTSMVINKICIAIKNSVQHLEHSV